MKQAAEHRKYFDPQTLAELRGLRLRAEHIVEGYLAGLHRSPLRGFSIEFAEHREYAAGDDLRHLDWKVFGRTDKYYLKQYEDETNLICYLVLDTSESMRYRSNGTALSKLEYAACIAAVLCWLLMSQHDAVSLTTYDNRIRTNIRPGSTAPHFKHVLECLESTIARGPSNTGRTLHELSERIQKRGIVLILSDLFDDVPSTMKGLKHLRHRQHDVLVFHLLDAAEIDFPFQQPTRFRGLEKSGDLVTDPRRVRSAYRAEINEFLDAVPRACRAQRIDYRLFRTDQPVDLPLTDFLTRRMNRHG